MVTQSVILVTPSVAAAFAATNSSSPAAAADSIISNAPAEQNSTEELQTNLFNYPSCTKPAQHPSPGGLVQLCRHEEFFNAVDFERRNGLCCVHQKNQKGPMDGEQNDSEDDGKIRGVTADEGLSDTHSTHGNNYGLDDEIGKKRDRPMGYSISGEDDMKRQRVDTDAFTVELTGVPPQPPIPKSAGRIKEGASKYTGVSFDKLMKKWKAQIRIDGRLRYIGYYENEEAAAADYARAVFKYKGKGALDNAREQDSFVIDLSDVPPQPPIPKSSCSIKEGASKYTGVSFNKSKNKWTAQIRIDGRLRYIGHYENEEEAAVDYARAVFKYKGQGHWDRSHDQLRGVAIGGNKTKKRQKDDVIAFDLTEDVPPQSPIPKSTGHIKEGASKYAGVTFEKKRKKWKAQINIDGKTRYIGYYENEEAAAADYARAAFKYKGKEALDKAREAKKENSIAFDLSDIPPQLPIPKSAGHVKDGASKYRGVYSNKPTEKWQARIAIDGKLRFIGSYENEEDAAADYARAVFKYKKQGALDKAREQNSIIIDLSDVPPHSPIPKSAGRIREGASKYVGVTFNKPMNKWQAQIRIDGKNRCIGHYENEEEAAVDYARAVFKYKGQGALDKARERGALHKSGARNSFIIDLSGVPTQSPIPKSERRIEDGASKYTGATFNKQMNKWQAQIRIDGKNRCIGHYENEEEAAVDYARAVFKYKGQGALDKARERRARDLPG